MCEDCRKPRAVASPAWRLIILFMRQSFEAGRGQLASSLSYEYPAGWRVPVHTHASDQLIYGVTGVMHVAISDVMWVLPPQFALWVPGNTAHGIFMPNSVSMRTLYFRPGLVNRRGCDVIAVSALLRELILETTRLTRLSMRRPSDRAFCSVLTDQIERAQPMPTKAAMPRDARARRLAESTLLKPDGSGDLAAKCRSAGIGVRTLQRIFRRELGVDFETWRRQARVLKAVELLVDGARVKEISYAVGYRQPSTFVAMFRKSLGMTPKAWGRRFARTLAER